MKRSTRRRKRSSATRVDSLEASDEDEEPSQNPTELGVLAGEFPQSNHFSENMSRSGKIISYYPVLKKGSNYLRHCTGLLSHHEKPSNIRECVKRYTSESGWYCSTINMALACDSVKLCEHGDYIKQLKYSIGMSRMSYNGTVFRGEIPALSI